VDKAELVEISGIEELGRITRY